jgi:hypothetical protein
MTSERSSDHSYYSHNKPLQNDPILQSQNGRKITNPELRSDRQIRKVVGEAGSHPWQNNDNDHKAIETPNLRSDIAVCSICHEYPVPAMRLESCGHVICIICYEAMLESRGPVNLLCQICRGPICKYPVSYDELNNIIKDETGQAEYEKRLKDTDKKKKKNQKHRMMKGANDFAVYPPEEREYFQREAINRKKKSVLQKKKQKEKYQKRLFYYNSLRVAFYGALYMCISIIIGLALSLPEARTKPRSARFVPFWIYVDYNCCYLLWCINRYTFIFIWIKPSRSNLVCSERKVY